jgi:hypothetical protein
MTEDRVTTKAALLEEIERAWAALNTELERLTEAQMTTLRDAQGWTVKDHLIHLAAWEQSVVFLLQGRPRHEGLGVEETVYLQGTYNDINAVIQQQHKHLPLTETLSQFRSTHQQLLTLLQPLTDADLNRRYNHYLPQEPREGGGPPVIDLLYGNTAHHFGEHLAWIKALVTLS